MEDLHHAIDVMHHPHQYTLQELERADVAIQEGPMKEFFKLYYRGLFQRIMRNRDNQDSQVGEIGYFGG
ncbi:MAG: hypothetical protein K6F95_09105 [Selenomonas sp.]|uniref:hypothetical protein n=1 Tax=Selenomonas sp. TaxID=2053611 RepID=UPI0025E30000|nr:hypothetical protein [Selenomonas sp.]MCR5758049.1 hypothetical protein [Selenomonas sp.]